MDRKEVSVIIGMIEKRVCDMTYYEIECITKLLSESEIKIKITYSNPDLPHNGDKVSAIKFFRELTGYGLKEAKEAIENGEVITVDEYPTTIPNGVIVTRA